MSVREGRLTLSWLVWLQTCRPHLQTPPEISSVSKNGQNCTDVPYLELLHDVGPTGEVEQPDVVDLADPGKAGDDSLHQLQVARLDLDLHPHLHHQVGLLVQEGDRALHRSRVAAPPGSCEEKYLKN